MSVTPFRRPAAAVATPRLGRRPLAPIPPAVFLEPAYEAAGEPFEIEPDDDWDDAA